MTGRDDKDHAHAKEAAPKKFRGSDVHRLIVPSASQ